MLTKLASLPRVLLAFPLMFLLPIRVLLAFPLMFLRPIRVLLAFPLMFMLPVRWRLCQAQAVWTRHQLSVHSTKK